MITPAYEKGTISLVSDFMGKVYVPFRHFLGDVLRQFMQRLFAALHGAMGSYLRDALHDVSANTMACLHGPWAKFFSAFLLFAWWPQISANSYFIRMLR
jgi:hypothetical protein